MTQDTQQLPEEQTLSTPLAVTIVTGERTVYDGFAETLVLPGIYGQIAIRRNHAALLAVLEPGEMLLKTGTDELDYVIGGGFVEVRDNQAIVLADSAERAEDIDIAAAEAARRRAESLVRRAGPTQPSASRSLALSRARLRVAMRHRPRRRR